MTTETKKRIAYWLKFAIIPALVILVGYLNGETGYGSAVAGIVAIIQFVVTGKKTPTSKIAKILLLALLPLACVCGGCNNFNAKSDMDAMVNTQGLAAFAAIVDGSPADIVKLKSDMTEDTALLQKYLDAATTNVWAYWFSDKKIFCSQAMYSCLEDFYAMSNEYLNNRLAAGTPENNAKQWRRNKAAVVIVRDWKIGGANSTGEKK